MKRISWVLTLVPLAAILTGCPDEEKKETPATASASASSVPVPAQTAAPATASATATATPATDASDDAAPVDAGKVADAGKPAATTPKK